MQNESDESLFDDDLPEVVQDTTSEKEFSISSNAEENIKLDHSECENLEQIDAEKIVEEEQILRPVFLKKEDRDVLNEHLAKQEAELKRAYEIEML